MSDETAPPLEPAGRDMRLSFFIMPIFFLKVLREEYTKVSGEPETRRILFRCGFRCGELLTSKMEISPKDEVNLMDTLMALWIEVGLGRLRVASNAPDRIVIESEDSTESLAVGRTGKLACDMTCGMIAGVASTVTSREYACSEEKCTSLGDSHCLYVLQPKGAAAA